MTVTPDRPVLAEALGIPGARAVALLDPDGPTVLWWAGAAPPDEQQAAAVVTLAAAAAGLVLLTGAGDELGDVLLTSAEAFHVVRLVEQETPRVAHLTLRRAGANLAMARREFRALTETYARQSTAPIVAEVAAPATRAGITSGSDDLPALPRRSRAEPQPETDEPELDVPPGWYDLFGVPYADDEDVLGRVLTTLRRL